MKKLILIVTAILVLNPAVSSAITIAPKFSVDPASPVIDGNITPDDVLTPGPLGPEVFTQGSDLGLQDDFFSGFFDNLNALSYGRDLIINPLFFSVDRVAVGLPGTDVDDQAQPGVEEAAGDVYLTLPPLGDNILFIDEEQLGLTPGFFGDDLDALELLTEPDPFTYFSIDWLSASNFFGAGDLANDILVSDGSGSFSIFAEGIANLGLALGDDLDALALLDLGTFGVLDPGLDLALFSLSTFSPSAFVDFSPADILFTDFSGAPPIPVWAFAAEVGLRNDDELNAISTIPEPKSIFLLASAILYIGIHQYRSKRKLIKNGGRI